jgi:hypothetical protein
MPFSHVASLMPAGRSELAFAQPHVHLQHAFGRCHRLLTSIEQKIQRIIVCTTTRPEEPIPSAKYIPRNLPTCGFFPASPLTSAHFLSQTLPARNGQHCIQLKAWHIMDSCLSFENDMQHRRERETSSLPICVVCAPINIEP